MSHTENLYTAAHTSLCQGQWSTALTHLRALGQRSDVADSLCTLDTYRKDNRLAGRAALDGRSDRDLIVQLADHITVINHRVMYY